jgi:hypothetical protein
MPDDWGTQRWYAVRTSEVDIPGTAHHARRSSIVTQSRSLALPLSLALVASALVACDALRAARGCGVVPLHSSVVAPVLSTSPEPMGADERERRARELMAARFGLPLKDVLVHERMTVPYPKSGITVYGFKLYGQDGRYLGPVLVDASGTSLSENAVALAETIAAVRERGKVGADLSDAVARSLPSDVVPVMFQLVAPPWEGPPMPWPLDLGAEEWNAFMERHADVVYRPLVAPFIEHLRSIGARDLNPALAPGTYVKDVWVFARVPSDEVCGVARRSDVLRAVYNPPFTVN